MSKVGLTLVIDGMILQYRLVVTLCYGTVLQIVRVVSDTGSRGKRHAGLPVMERALETVRRAPRLQLVQAVLQPRLENFESRENSQVTKRNHRT